MSELYQLEEFNVGYQQLSHLASEIDAGRIVACPTNNGYSLITSSKTKESIKRLQKFFAKEKRLPVVFYNSVAALAAEINISQSIFKLIKKNTPSACTFVVSIAPAIAQKIVHERRTEIGIRIPDESLVQQILEYTSSPYIISFGAFDSDSEEFSVFADELVEKMTGLNLLVIDYDRSVAVSASTIVDCKSWPVDIIRQGDFVLEN